MSWIEEIKQLFHTRADELSERLGRIENHLGAIEASNDKRADQLDYELRSQMFVIPASNPNGTSKLAQAAQILEVPKGSWYEVIGWTSTHAEADKAVLTRNGILFDVPQAYNSNIRYHKSQTQGLVLLPGDVLGAINIEKEQETTVWIQFKVYKEAPDLVTQTGEGG